MHFRGGRGIFGRGGDLKKYFDKIIFFSTLIGVAGGPVVPPPGALISIVTPSIINQEHTIKHAVKTVEKEYSCITSNLIWSEDTNPKKSTTCFIHIYVNLYEKTNGQMEEQTDRQMNRVTDLRTEEHVSLFFVRTYVHLSVRSQS